MLPIWEGTTDVLALDTLRVLAQQGGLDIFETELRRSVAAADSDTLRVPARLAGEAFEKAAEWFHAADSRESLEAGARRFALTLGRALELALLARHASWAGDQAVSAMVARFAESPVGLILARARPVPGV